MIPSYSLACFIFLLMLIIFNISVYRKCFSSCSENFRFVSPFFCGWTKVLKYNQSIFFCFGLVFLVFSKHKHNKLRPNDACLLSVNGTAQFIYFYGFVFEFEMLVKACARSVRMFSLLFDSLT